MANALIVHNQLLHKFICIPDNRFVPFGCNLDRGADQEEPNGEPSGSHPHRRPDDLSEPLFEHQSFGVPERSGPSEHQVDAKDQDRERIREQDERSQECGLNPCVQLLHFEPKVRQGGWLAELEKEQEKGRESKGSEDGRVQNILSVVLKVWGLGQAVLFAVVSEEDAWKHEDEHGHTVVQDHEENCESAI